MNSTSVMRCEWGENEKRLTKTNSDKPTEERNVKGQQQKLDRPR